MLLTAALGAVLALAGPFPQDLADLFPAERRARLSVPDGAALLDSRLGTSLADLISEQGDADGLARLEGAVRLASGAEPRAVLRLLVGGGVELGVYAGRGRGGTAGKRRLLAISRATDADDLQRLFDAFVALIESGRRDAVSRERHAGRTLATVDGDLSLCAADGLLLVATDVGLVRAALDRLDRVAPPPPRQPGAPLLSFEFDARLVRARDTRALSPPKGTPGRRYTNPLANLLFAGLGASEGVTSGELREDDGRLVLDTRLPGSLADAAAAYAPPADAPVEVPLSAETAAVLFARRDLADWWRHREALLDEEVQPRLANFDQTLGQLFMGGSPAEDVFAGVRPELALVIDRLDFGGAAPDVRMPGACLVARMRDPEGYSTGMQVAFQTLIGIANTERAKDGKPPFLLETVEHDGVTLRCARLVSDDAAGGMAGGSGERDVERALSPTLAFVDDRLLLGTSEEQVRRLVSAWRDGRRIAFRGNTELRVDARVVARLVRDNRGPLVAKSMLDDGLDPHSAGRRLDALLAVLDRFGTLALEVEDAPDGARVGLRVDPPDAPP